MTDNGSAYKSHLFRDTLAAEGIKHKRTRPNTPKTNGKAERFIQTSLREWLYARAYDTSVQRTAAMPAWLIDYNNRRPHAALGGKPPIARLIKDIVLGNDTQAHVLRNISRKPSRGHSPVVPWRLARCSVGRAAKTRHSLINHQAPE